MGSIQFYTDTNCYTQTNDPVVGPNDGTCTQFGTVYPSWRVISLEQTCAVTIYNSDADYCSSSIKFIADLGTCYSNQTTNQFSVDCQDPAAAASASPSVFSSTATSRTSQSILTSATVATVSGTTVTLISTVSAPEPTSSSVSSNSSSSAPSSGSGSGSGLSTGAKTGLGVGIALGVTVVLVGAFFLWRHQKRKSRAIASNSTSGNNAGASETPPIYEDKKEPLSAAPSEPSELANTVAKRAELPDSTKKAIYEAPGDELWPRQELQGSQTDTALRTT